MHSLSAESTSLLKSYAADVGYLIRASAQSGPRMTVLATRDRLLNLPEGKKLVGIDFSNLSNTKEVRQLLFGALIRTVFSLRDSFNLANTQWVELRPYRPYSKRDEDDFTISVKPATDYGRRPTRLQLEISMQGKKTTCSRESSNQGLRIECNPSDFAGWTKFDVFSLLQIFDQRKMSLNIYPPSEGKKNGDWILRGSFVIVPGPYSSAAKMFLDTMERRLTSSHEPTSTDKKRRSSLSPASRMKRSRAGDDAVGSSGAELHENVLEDSEDWDPAVSGPNHRNWTLKVW